MGTLLRYNAWATYIASDLNWKATARRLGYSFAEPNVQFSRLKLMLLPPLKKAIQERGTLLVALINGRLPFLIQPSNQIPLKLQEISTSLVATGPTLAGQSIFGPANKDRRGDRRAFVAKCET